MKDNVLPYDALISDFDGTLLPNSELINQKAVVETMRKRGFELRRAEQEGIPGRPSSEIIPLLLIRRRLFEPELHRRVIEENRSVYDALWDKEVALDPGVGNTLGELHARGVPVGIATTNRRKVVEKFLDRFNLRDVVSVIVSRDEVSRIKPHPEVYETAWRQLGKKRSLAVEDMPSGIRSARAAGLHCAAIPREYTVPLDLLGATYILGSFSDLLELF